MTFERFFEGVKIILGRLLVVLIVRSVITQKDADFITCQISEDEWCESEGKNDNRSI